MGTHWRRWAIVAAIALVSAVAARLLSSTHFFTQLNLKTYDAHFVWRGDERVSDVFLVTLDERANNAYREPGIFWHQHYAAAIKAAGLGGAKVVGLDLAFGISVEEWAKDNDRLLAEAVTLAPMPVVIGYASQINGDQERLKVPVNMMAAAMGLAGFTNLTVDPDDFVRSQELIESVSPDPKAPPPERSLAMRVTEKFLDKEAVFENGRLTLDGKLIPLTPQRSIAIHFAGGPDTFPRMSIVDFIAKGDKGEVEELRKLVQGKIVLIGTDIRGIDTFGTPFYTALKGTKNLTAGVEIHANTIHTLLEGKFLLPVQNWVRNLALILATVIAAFISVRFSAGRAVGLLILVAAAIAVITHWMFLNGKILSTSETLAALVFCLVGSIAFRFATEEKRRRLFSNAVTLFVGKDVVKGLDRSEKIELTGKTLEVTILFTDIRGFTAYTDKMCQDHGPELLVEQLNEYMAQMVAIIVKYHGHVNKFIGDGILAVFSDDDEGSTPGDHAARGVRCAYEMVTAPSRFSTGSGLHSGTVVVGNIGSKDKMEYTVLGDTVNLASRLESLNKERHTKLLMSGATQELLNGAMETSLLGSFEVRGKSQPVSLYTATSLLPEPVPEPAGKQ
ncbi:MAG TPA: adenylate/guanylate cyclase domain-containing protein [Bryobacteraceae bacterium]|nr:adenylate/guanylate cyclase domain-containing protein [Bryobacteraceae bacterium]